MGESGESGELGDRIEELDSKIKSMQEEKLSLEILEMTRRNAEILHEKFCAGNHARGCEWFNEIKDGIVDWDGPAHKKWSQRSNRLIHTGYQIKDVVTIKDIMGLNGEEIKISRLRIVKMRNGRDGGEEDVLVTYPFNEGSGITIDGDCSIEVEIDGKWRKIWELRISSMYVKCDVKCDR